MRGRIDGTTMNMNPKVNVIVPVYNVEQYLPKFLESLRKQTFQDFDVWIVDDKSTDHSRKILFDYRDKFGDKFHIICNESNVGLCQTRNIGLDACTTKGEYVIMLDSDDYVSFDFLNKMVAEADRDHADVTICGLERFDDSTGKVICREMIHNPDELITDIEHFSLLGYLNPVVWNKLYRWEAIGNTRFTTIKRSEDTVFLFTLLPRIHSIRFINEVLYYYRVRGSSLSGAITEEIYYSMLDGFAETKRHFENNTRSYGRFMDLFTVQMFIRCGLGGACRLSFRDLKKTHYYVSYTKKYMDLYFKDWRENVYLSFSRFWKKKTYEKALTLAAFLYKANLFGLFVYGYWFVSIVLKKDMRA